MRILQKYDPNAIPVPKLPANIHELRAAQRGQAAADSSRTSA